MTLDQTLLMLAIISGDKSAVRSLVKIVSVNGQDENGVTPLMAAVVCNDLKTVYSLLSHGADVSVKNNLGKTALNIAIDLGRSSIIPVLRKGV